MFALSGDRNRASASNFNSQHLPRISMGAISAVAAPDVCVDRRAALRTRVAVREHHRATGDGAAT